MDKLINCEFSVRPKYHMAAKKTYSYSVDFPQKIWIVNAVFYIPLYSQCLEFNSFSVIVEWQLWWSDIAGVLR